MVGPFAWWHYVDLTGAVLGLTLVPVGYVLSRSAKGR